MIAVFSKHHGDFLELRAAPANMFKRIRFIDDIRGCDFIGIIRTRGWHNADIEAMRAYEALEKRQPELFK